MCVMVGEYMIDQNVTIGSEIKWLFDKGNGRNIVVIAVNVIFLQLLVPCLSQLQYCLLLNIPAYTTTG